MFVDRKARIRGVAAVLAALSVLMGTTACGDDPFAFDWGDDPDTVFLYSMARPELNLVSGFSFFQGIPIQVEAPSVTGSWDIAVDTRDGEIVLLPPGALGVFTEAEVAPIANSALYDVNKAPADSLRYISDEPIPVEFGTVYVVRTNRSPGRFGSTCVYYAKMEAVDIDPVGGTFTFRHVTNPICNSRDLVPPN